jgi:proteasome assembly chaperone (PAC2) family protein
LSERHHFTITRNPQFLTSTMVVCWEDDGGKLGTRVADYLIEKLGCLEFAELDPESFFPLAGVRIENDIALFPDCKFYFNQEKELVVFKGRAPRSAWYEYLCSLTDVAREYCYAKEIYTVGSMISFGAHTFSRQIMAVANSEDMKSTLKENDLALGADFETPPGQRPTLSSYLLWVAQRLDIAAATLWVPIPFYLLSLDDPQASRTILHFLDHRLNLGMDFHQLDDEAADQIERLAELRRRTPEIDRCIRKLEMNEGLNHDETEKLVRGVEEHLRG